MDNELAFYHIRPEDFQELLGYKPTHEHSIILSITSQVTRNWVPEKVEAWRLMIPDTRPVLQRLFDDTLMFKIRPGTVFKLQVSFKESKLNDLYLVATINNSLVKLTKAQCEIKGEDLEINTTAHIPKLLSPEDSLELLHNLD
jgi:hypothetical protein